MKEAIITDLTGKYIEPTIVADDVTGIFEQRKPAEENTDTPIDKPLEEKSNEELEEQKTKLVGYIIAIRPPDGLYEPTFDLAGYKKAIEDYEVAYAQYSEAVTKHNHDSSAEGDPLPNPPQQVEGSSFWHNGLTDEEIKELQAQSKPTPSQHDILGQEFTQMKVQNIQQQTMIDRLGVELTKAKLKMMEMSGVGGTNE